MKYIKQFFVALIEVLQESRTREARKLIARMY